MTGVAGRAVIVGGGVIGTTCAYYLSQSGWKVTVVDRGEFGKGCSHGNCGLVCPSHVLPLAGPGAVRNALKALLRKDSPFYIKPRLDLSLWGWLLRFARRCNVHDMMDAGRAIQALLNSSRSLYEDLMRTEALDCEWETRGLLYVYRSSADLEHSEATERLLREAFDLPATRYDGPGLSELEPALKPGLAGGWLYPMDAQLRPDKLLSAWRGVLESRGVIVREHCDVKGFDHTSQGAGAVLTPEEALPAEAIVVATGALTPLLRKHLGCSIPIQPGKGYSITMPRPARCPKLPLIFEEHRVAVTPMRSGYRLGSTMVFAGYDQSLNPRRLAPLKEGARHYLQEPYAEPVEEEWYGWRPMTPDGLPMIGRVPRWPNVYLAAGHNMLGLSMAPATGKLIAEILSGATPHLDPAPYAVTRF